MSFVVTLTNDYKSDHLKAVADDGTHGLANCQFPKVWNGISREDFKNEGRQFEVRGLEWTGKFYRVKRTDVIREIPTGGSATQNQSVKQQINNWAEEQEKSNANTGITPIFDTNNESTVVDLSFFDEALTGRQIREKLFDDKMSQYFN